MYLQNTSGPIEAAQAFIRNQYCGGCLQPIVWFGSGPPIKESWGLLGVS